VKAYDFNSFKKQDFIPIIIPNWDNTPRSGKRGWVFRNSTPEVFGMHLTNTLNFVKARKSTKPKIIFIKSWNEWAEGNYLEPDLRWGRGYLEAVKKAVEEVEIENQK